MMIHVVLLKPKPEVTEAQLARALDHVRAFQEQIPGILRIAATKNRSGKNQGYTHGFLICFADADAMARYPTYPAHDPVARELRELSESIIDFDLEMEFPQG